VIFHIARVAKGAADIVRQMVGQDVPLAWCGGNRALAWGTSVDAIEKALQAAWSDRGVVIWGYGTGRPQKPTADGYRAVGRRGSEPVCSL